MITLHIFHGTLPVHTMGRALGMEWEERGARFCLFSSEAGLACWQPGHQCTRNYQISWKALKNQILSLLLPKVSMQYHQPNLKHLDNKYTLLIFHASYPWYEAFQAKHWNFWKPQLQPKSMGFIHSALRVEGWATKKRHTVDSSDTAFFSTLFPASKWNKQFPWSCDNKNWGIRWNDMNRNVLNANYK